LEVKEQPGAVRLSCDMCNRIFACLGLATWLAVAAFAQSSTDNLPDQNQQNIQTEPMAQTPTYTVNVVSRTIEAVNYRDRGGSTQIGMKGTDLMPKVDGSAKVSGHTGRLAVDINLHHLKPARDLGAEFLTYVAWAITPEGRPVNLGEVIPKGDGDVSTQLTTSLQTFGLMITAEPYFAVTRPSDTVVVQNEIGPNVKGTIRPIHAKFDLLQRGQYTVNLSAAELPATSADVKKIPLQLLEARNAVSIAQAAGAQQYASDTFRKAEDDLTLAENYYRQKQNQKAIGTAARAATQSAEDARLLTVDRKDQARQAAARQQMEERIRNERDQAELARDRAELARMQAQQEADQRARAESEREAAEAATAQAQQARTAAEQQLQQSELERQQATQQAQQAQLQTQQVEQQSRQQRERLLAQLNQVLQTKDTARGLVANMPDVLFDVDKSTLREPAKVPLAKVAGIIQSYPDLKLEIDGFTDSTGTPEHNEVLSEQRAASVRDFLITQGVPADNVSARGFGESDPIASNATASGRQENRRVELVVSGTAIGQNIGAPAVNGPSTNASGDPGAAARGISGTATAGSTGTATGTGQSTNAAPSTPGTSTVAVPPAAIPKTQP
jgi:outer membrane protein OmpA-like peptidoglycan-associated protein